MALAKKPRLDSPAIGMKNFVLRWDIDDALTRYGTGKVESEKFNEGGFKWITGFKQVGNGLKIYLQCAVDHNDPWKCEVNLTVWAIDISGRNGRSGVKCDYGKGHFFFSEKNSHRFFMPGTLDWMSLYDTAQFYSRNGKSVYEFHIRIISSDRERLIVDRSLFTTPNNRSDVILVIGENKLHVSKEYLAVQSPVFETLFFGDFAEKGKKEVEIKDVIYEEFHDLLQLIYNQSVEITDYTVPHILKLSDRFQIKSIVERSKKHLAQSMGIDVVKKLLLADRYNILSLRDFCLNSFTNERALLVKLKLSNEFANFSDGLKAAVAQKLIDLTVVS